jgi:hypothetical protein
MPDNVSAITRVLRDCCRLMDRIDAELGYSARHPDLTADYERLAALRDELLAANPAIDVRTLCQDLADCGALDRVEAATADLEIGLLVYNVGAETQYGTSRPRLGRHRARLQRNIVKGRARPPLRRTHALARARRHRPEGLTGRLLFAAEVLPFLRSRAEDRAVPRSNAGLAGHYQPAGLAGDEKANGPCRLP